nr:uncharacterized protein LOC106623491 isoform X3 [Bactrocera oleae]
MKFIAILPQPTEPGHKIQISGRISNNAEEFSINFANETNDHPQSIAYHFKWDVAKKMLIEDYKEDNEWKKRNATAFDIFDDTTDTFPHSYSLLGLEFALEFAFQDDGIYVYMVCEDARNHVTHFQPEIDIQFIESVQVWGDVEKITQLSFSYN